MTTVNVPKDLAWGVPGSTYPQEAIRAGADVHGHFVSSSFKNFEWDLGDCPRFGLVRVNHKTLARIPKQRVCWFSEVTHDVRG
jgi:beta-glucosidase/6-phospho-beta-glucosidase/beta-galactosidase